MDSLRGKFLVASPHLPDSNFFRTVVLMIQHDADGAFGIVLNRPARKTVSELWEMVGEPPCECSQLIYVGGPVEGPLLALHACRPYAETEVLPRVYASTRKDLLDKIVRSPGPFRLFLGYAGWGPGQLENELEAGGWLTSPATADDVFAEPENLWKRITGEIGLQILAPTLGKRRVPDEPWWN